MLLEQNDEWQTQNRYMQTEPMAELTPPAVDVFPPQITTEAACATATSSQQQITPR